jgi:hypothetical protein
MRNLKLRWSVVIVIAVAASAWAIAATSAPIRFCCTPQQSAACAAQGGTASCRTGVCQCLF